MAWVASNPKFHDRESEASVRRLVSQMEHEDERDARLGLAKLVSEARVRTGSGTDKMWAALRKAACRLGYESYVEAYDEWKALLCGDAEQTCRNILKATAPAYSLALAPWSRVVSDVVAPGDIPWIARGQPWPASLPPLNLTSLVRLVAKSLGLISSLNSITVDFGTRSGKSSRPFCSAVLPPGEVYLVGTPSGRTCDLEETLHELGHALAFVHANSALPKIQRVAVDDSTAEAFAFLCGSLAGDEDFVEFSTGSPPALARHMATDFKFVELYLIRRYCVKCLFALSFLGSNTSVADYQELTRHHLGFFVPTATGRQDLERGLYAWEYVRGWIGSRMLKEMIVAEFGDEWYRSQDAGAALAEVWSLGPSVTLESFLGPLDPGSLVRDVVR